MNMLHPDFIGQYDLGLIHSLKNIPSSGNVLFDIQADTGHYFLRFNPSAGPRARSRDEVLAEVEVLEHLNSQGFPVPEVMQTTEGETVVEYNGSFGYLRTFVEGEPKLNPSVEEVERVGELLGWMHTLTQGYRTKQERVHRWDLESTRAFFEIKKSILPNGFVHSVSQVLDQLSFPEDLSVGMIHEDLGCRHVLWNNGEIVGVIDFDRMYFGPLIFDLGQVARGWCFVNDWTQWDQERFEVLIEGYESKRVLTPKERSVLLDAVRFALVERAISFMVRFLEFTHDPKHKEFAERSIHQLLAQL